MRYLLSAPTDDICRHITSETFYLYWCGWGLGKLVKTSRRHVLGVLDLITLFSLKTRLQIKKKQLPWLSRDRTCHDVECHIIMT